MKVTVVCLVATGKGQGRYSIYNHYMYQENQIQKTEKGYQENISTWAWMTIFYVYSFLLPVVGIHSALVVCLGGFSLCDFF